MTETRADSGASKINWIAKQQAATDDQIVPPGSAPIPNPIGSFRSFVAVRARQFALERYGRAVELRFGKRGLHADDCAAFLRAVQVGDLQVSANGSFVIKSCRPKLAGNRYSLFTANRWNDDHYVSLNTENLIHFGAASELASAHGWPPGDIEVEVGEFDARVWQGDRAGLLMEAKARVTGPDSLAPLLRSIIKWSKQPEPPEAIGNHARKYVELLKQTEAGPVLLWLVAAGARWAFKVVRKGNRIELTEASGPSPAAVAKMQKETKMHNVSKVELRPRVEHAVGRAMLTESDSRQRAYEFPWTSREELQGFKDRLKKALPKAGITQTRPWIWTMDTSGGKALTPCGKDTGLELRLSYSPAG